MLVLADTDGYSFTLYTNLIPFIWLIKESLFKLPAHYPCVTEYRV